VAWADLPGWNTDRVAEALPALLQSCTRLAGPTATAAWRQACADVAAVRDTNDAALRFWLESRFAPFRVEAPDGNATGLLTGYYEPLLEASRQRRAGFEVPLYRPPADLQSRRPWFTRQEIESPNTAAAAALRGREIAYLADPVDALVLHIQGSGRLNLREADGSTRVVRVAFAGHNDQPYRSVGRWLIDQRELTAAQASWPGIKAWIERTRPANPQRVQEMFFTNPRYVFFREEAAPVADDSLTPLATPTGPRGAQGVPLLAGRSVAVDREAVPYGTPLWLDSTDATGAVNGGRPIQRLVVAQDTGSAILGAVRADYFWGFGNTSSEVADQAGRTRQPLRYWALWPR
jgi:membrane-bound lytic murein transglycosylase A